MVSFDDLNDGLAFGFLIALAALPFCFIAILIVTCCGPFTWCGKDACSGLGATLCGCLSCWGLCGWGRAPRDERPPETRPLVAQPVAQPDEPDEPDEPTPAEPVAPTRPKPAPKPKFTRVAAPGPACCGLGLLCASATALVFGCCGVVARVRQRRARRRSATASATLGAPLGARAPLPLLALPARAPV